MNAEDEEQGRDFRGGECRYMPPRELGEHLQAMWVPFGGGKQMYKTTQLSKDSHPMASRSTRPNPSRSINWLFFNPVNTRSKVHGLSVPGHPSDIGIGDLDWATELEKKFGFSADTSTIEFQRARF